MSGIVGHRGLLLDIGGITGTLLLDLLPPGVGHGYSVRRVRTAYAGSALRVRRSSDNAEQDIGFSGNDLDSATLLSFVGAGSGFVVTWYDQGGNGLDATMATTANQPRIVNAGTLDTENSKPSIVFDGTNDVLASAYSSSAPNSTRQFTSAVVERSQRTSSSNEAFYAFRRSGQRDYDSGFVHERRTTNISVGLTTGAGGGANNYVGRQGADSNTTALSQAAYFITPQTPAEAMYIDNTLKTLSNSYVSGTGAVGTHQNAGSGPHQIIIGNGNQTTTNASFDRPFQGKLSEILVWASDQVANRSTIYTDQKAYFGTP
ncbi:hypothetical protein [Variovorax ginsengisoli]|uniref:Alpha-L-arabinofuranosidase B catalytic domain-containing protein n=1 Tax=Variovorax ginsengisoli TaxID=363844 RepID=A0ABT8S0C3_9BURK|nr:hypothetical protein [Variovorax ginsengisoli]MDN8612808.1 hypothetical protein [Variovorax ginsengisoli]MDO1531978.1 hypothetical protein [Variovorax ginsengisoli]